MDDFEMIDEYEGGEVESSSAAGTEQSSAASSASASADTPSSLSEAAESETITIRGTVASKNTILVNPRQVCIALCTLIFEKMKCINSVNITYNVWSFVLG